MPPCLAPRRSAAALAFAATLLVGSIAAPSEVQQQGGRLESRPPRSEAEPSEVHQLAREGMAHNLAGDLDAADAVWARLRERFPEHPAAAYLPVTTLFWRQILDPLDPAYDAAILRGLEETLARSRARLARDPDDADASYYLGTALVSQGRLLAMRGSYYEAGTTGREGRRVLEEVLDAHPQLVEARYPLGLYLYYASLAPRILRWLTWLWFVPRGDAERGLRLLETVREEGGPHRLEATYILSNIYTYYEPERRTRGLALVDSLVERFPRNTFLRFERIEALFLLGRYAAVEAAAEALEALPEAKPWDAGMQRSARVWRARAALYQGEPERAEEVLAGVSRVREDPPWIGAWIELTRGQIADLHGRRDAAREHYAAVLARGGWSGSRRASELAEAGLSERFHAPGRVIRAAE